MTFFALQYSVLFFIFIWINFLRDFQFINCFNCFNCFNFFKLNFHFNFVDNFNFITHLIFKFMQVNKLIVIIPISINLIITN